jgi:hypothetical protein
MSPYTPKHGRYSRNHSFKEFQTVRAFFPGVGFDFGKVMEIDNLSGEILVRQHGGLALTTFSPDNLSSVSDYVRTL